jgi:hypothetical protein
MSLLGIHERRHTQSILLEFWERKTLYKVLLQGIIRLLPKKLTKRKMKDWRPLTLLQLIYKLLAKLLAVRMGLILLEIVSPRQTGFVSGTRQILDSISIANLINDWAIENEYLMLLLSLDFEGL